MFTRCHELLEEMANRTAVLMVLEKEQPDEKSDPPESESKEHTALRLPFPRVCFVLVSSVPILCDAHYSHL